MPANRRLRTVLLALSVLALTTGCTGGPARQQQTVVDVDEEPAAIRIASFDFAESQTLAELYARALEAKGFTVQRITGLGSRELVEPALEQGLVDFVPEYLGSALRFLERNSDAAIGDPVKAHRQLTEAFAARGVKVLAAAPAENRNTVVVRRDTAERYGLATVGDLLPVAGELALGGPPECAERSTCLQGLERRYGLSFGAFVPLTPARNVVAALEAGDIDIGLLFSTDPSAASGEFVELDDDRDLQPAENVVPVVRAEVVERAGGAFVQVVDEVTMHLRTEDLVQLNQLVVVEGRDPSTAAQEWLRARGFTT